MVLNVARLGLAKQEAIGLENRQRLRLGPRAVTHENKATMSKISKISMLMLNLDLDLHLKPSHSPSIVILYFH